MSDGINLKARIHNTVLLLNDTPLFHGQFATIGNHIGNESLKILYS